ncbi:MAG TPA: methyltransferase [Methyloceanibacter sp.]|nr:methyltransferase [Methyloceanibacter sp.]
MSSPTTRSRKQRSDATSTDDFLGGRISVAQPRKGHRAGSDAVFLAASVPARGRDRVLDIGAASGIAGLCLLARVPGIDVTAVEIDPGLAALAAHNAAENGFAARFRSIAADVTSSGKTLAAAGLKRESYQHLMVNPPFYTERSVRAAPDRARAAAHVMGEGGLAAWVRFFAAMAAPNGLLTMIHRPDCLAQLLALLEGRFGSVAVFPLFPRSGEAATRIIVQAKKGSRAGLSLLPGLVLHDGAGGYTEAAEAVLRGGAALKLRGSSEG